MWLINCHTFALEFFYDPMKVKYAILSHTWGDGEVTFKDMEDLKKAQSLRGFAKIRGTCERAIKDGFQYAWVDTCCIDKSSSAELSEAINSTFLVPIDEGEAVGQLFPREEFCKSRWFTRGWTLQELIAPTDLRLYDTKWNLLAIIRDDKEAVDAIERRTGILGAILVRRIRQCDRCSGDKIKRMCRLYRRQRNSLGFLGQYTIAERMSWAAKRETTRPEDRAYSLLGIFGVNMPLLYGEGSRSFARLQQEIVKTTHDKSILAHRSGGSAFAGSPDSFDMNAIMGPDTAVHVPLAIVKLDYRRPWLSSKSSVVEMRSNGKSVEMSMLLCPVRSDDPSGIDSDLPLSDGLSRPAVLLRQLRTNSKPKTFYRDHCGCILQINALSSRRSLDHCITWRNEGT
ncbi:hypothetical protein QBC34DRAFT_467909 [Podospora aff. communis PSN243]|uniref:Heterokaryon incompatibility domain-containing protein n=1 Tax=Podospora aff. communis PSN243 TaxID=3040156 RepID=A0AAV9GJY5_9PEZI|nr:hypothetical protein QBC34DRAFT_467909 [Podospora aff. communis PSN243]